MAERLRLAVYGTELSRKGPGLLLKDILKGDDPQVAAVVAIIARAEADAILLTGIDWDHGGLTLAALADRLSAAGVVYPYRFAPEPNTGRPTGLDLDGDGRSWRARDAQGWGLYTGHGGLALLSRLPLEPEAAQDFTSLLWRDLPGALLPPMSPEALAVQRLSTTGHWTLPLVLPSGARLTLMAFAATPPVFDGPEDRNGLRNADEIRLWQRHLDGAVGTPPDGAFALLGTANLDPVDGEGRHGAIRALLADPRLQDPRPASPGGAAAATPDQRGDPALDTADWPEPTPGNLRVEYILPSANLTVRDAGVLWSPPGTEASQIEATASRHRLVWVDLDF